MDSIKTFIDNGGSVLVMLGEGGEEALDTNINYLTEQCVEWSWRFLWRFFHCTPSLHHTQVRHLCEQRCGAADSVP